MVFQKAPCGGAKPKAQGENPGEGDRQIMEALKGRRFVAQIEQLT